MNIDHKIGIIAKFHGPTNCRGSRVSLTLPRWDNKRIYFAWDYGQGTSSHDQAIAWLTAQGVEIDETVDMGDQDLLTVKFGGESADKIFKLFGV